MYPENEYVAAARRARKKLAFYFHFLLGILIHAFFTFSNLHARCWRKMVEKEINALEKSKNIRR